MHDQSCNYFSQHSRKSKQNQQGSLRAGSHLGTHARAAKSEYQKRRDPVERSLMRRPLALDPKREPACRLSAGFQFQEQ